MICERNRRESREGYKDTTGTKERNKWGKITAVM
jgi:hypothetical protein